MRAAARKAEPAGRGIAEVITTADEVALYLKAAEDELEALTASRREVVEGATLDELIAHDGRIARVHASIEQLLAKQIKLRAELDAAKAGDEAGRRIAMYEAALRARDGAGKLFADYTIAAQNVAALVNEIAVIEHTIAQANRALPEGAEPIPPAEPSNGSPRRLAEYAPQVTKKFFKNGREVMAYDAGDRSIEVRAVIGQPMLIDLGAPEVEHTPLAKRVQLGGVGKSQNIY